MEITYCFDSNVDYLDADVCILARPGCPDSTALNFAADANQDDGSCLKTPNPPPLPAWPPPHSL